jgi:RNA polymerase sigma-70 factor (ECF subfamily)
MTAPQRDAFGDADVRAPEDDLASRYWERVRLFALRRVRDAAAAEDIAQEVIRRVTEALRAGRIEEPAAMPGYVFRTALYVCLHHGRSAGREARALDRFAMGGSGPHSGEDALTTLISAERRATVRLALERLAPADRELLWLLYFQQVEPVEIARRLSVTADALRVRKHRVLRRLAEALGESDS